MHKSVIVKELVGASGFEPPTSWSRTRRSSQAEPRPERFTPNSKTVYSASFSTATSSLHLLNKIVIVPWS